MRITRSSIPRFFFSGKEKKKIMDAIREAEKTTSGEIRVHLERAVKGDIMEHAKKVFERLKMNETAARNGVLILMGIKNRRFSIIGDSGIDEKVPPGFWDDVTSLMAGYFRENLFAEGLTEGIKRVGEKLKTYFPYQKDDVNELPDDISY